MAERAGFEPAVGLLALRRFSKPLVSATHPPLRFMACETHRTEPLSRDKPAAGSPSAGLAPVATGAPTGSAAHSSGRSATHPPLRFMACETHRPEPLSRDKPAAASPPPGLRP